MKNEQSYIHILIDSLYKKIHILDEISKFNQEQKIIFEKEDMTLDEIEPSLQIKQDLIDRLNALDEGFETLYSRVSEGLKENKKQYASEIAEMKKLIAVITEKSMKVQAEETQNKNRLEQHFSNFKRQIRNSKTSGKAVTNYYNSMNQLQHVDPQFMDKKK